MASRERKRPESTPPVAYAPGSPCSLLPKLPPQLLERLIHQPFPASHGAAGADDLVVPLRIGDAVGDVADRAVGEFGDHRLLEWRTALHLHPELDEDFARQADPGEVIAQ